MTTRTTRTTKKAAAPTEQATPGAPQAAAANRQNEEAFRRIIAALPGSIQELALAARALILRILPQAYEIVWETQKTAGYGTGPKKMTEHFCWLLFGDKHVALGFYYGTELPDPKGLLEGTGKLMRHVKLRGAEDLKEPALKELIRVATTHRVPPPRG